MNSYLIDLKGMPSALIAGSVNAITGNYSETHLDLQVSGINSIPLITNYSSSDCNFGSLCYGWDISLKGDLTQSSGMFTRRSVVTDGDHNIFLKEMLSHVEIKLANIFYPVELQTHQRDD